jgi:hypothetical protein
MKKYKQDHFWIAGACIVGIGFGYILGSSRPSSSSPGNPPDQVIHSRSGKAPSREREARESNSEELLSSLLNGRAAKDIPDAELVKIIHRLSKYDATLSSVARARQNFQLQLLLEKLPTSRLEQAAEALSADPDSVRNGSTFAIVNAMASKDPQRALAWAKTQNDPSRMQAAILGAMAKDDPITAADLYREGLLDGTFNPSDNWTASSEIANCMAKLGKKQLLSFVDSLPRVQQHNMISRCFHALSEGDQLEMLNEMYQRSKDGRLQVSIRSVFSSALNSNRSQAETWLAKMEPGKERATLELSAANSLSQNGDPDAAREWMSRAIAHSAGNEDELLKEAFNQMIYNNPAYLAVFTSLLPQGIELRADDLKKAAIDSARQGFSGLTRLARAIRDPAEQTKLITTVLDDLANNTSSGSSPSRLNAADFEIFTRQIRTLDLSGENAAKIDQSLAAVRNAKPNPHE